MDQVIHTVEPVLSGHPWGTAKSPFNTCRVSTNTGPLKMNFGCGQIHIHILLKYITGNNNK